MAKTSHSEFSQQTLPSTRIQSALETARMKDNVITTMTKDELDKFKTDAGRKANEKEKEQLIADTAKQIQNRVLTN